MRGTRPGAALDLAIVTGHGANADANGDHCELIDVLPNGAEIYLHVP